LHHDAVRRDLPTGTVTFLFTDIEGSTRLLHELGAADYAQALAEHRRLLREAFSRHGGVEVDTQGDAFFVAFPTAPGALAAAQEARDALARGPVLVRMGLHTGTPHVGEEGYVGHDVHKGARIAAVGHGGQVLLSQETCALVDGEVTDLGEHRLKDLDQPLSIFQLGSERFPPLKTISNTNLPRPASSFVGREQEVEEVAALLQDGARLLTLTGPGGSGKTRLALEAAAELVPEFKAGVFWVGLAPLRDPALVAETIAQTLGAKDGLAEHIGERELLLLLDNLEQVVAAAPELAALVETCPNLRLLVTSRELLRVRGEVEYPVLPLAEPEAVELFCTRAPAKPDETVHALCRALDNLPLALELAAARASVLSPRQILERLAGRLDVLKGSRDADPRQQTLRATIEWSYELLPEEEQRLFARLAVFAGGCTLEAAEVVADADLDTLQSLVDKSLVRHTGERFWMLETISQFAAERLAQSGETAVRRQRHADHLLAVAEEAEPHLAEAPKEWLDRLEVEHDNFRTALEWFESSGETQLVLRLAGALWRFWNMRGHLSEGFRRLERALATDPRPTAARAKVLNAAGAMAVMVEEDSAKARLRAEEALALHRELGDTWGSAYSRFLFGFAAVEEGKFAEAPRHLEESLRLFRELGDEHYAGIAAFNLAWAYQELGESDRARALAEERLSWARATGNEREISFCLDLLEWEARQAGRMEEALSMLQESLRIRVYLDDPIHIADTLSRFASALAGAGQGEVATRLLSHSIFANGQLGIDVPLYQQKRNEQTLATIRAQLEEARFAEAWEHGEKLTTDEAVALALTSEVAR